MKIGKYLLVLYYVGDKGTGELGDAIGYSKTAKNIQRNESPLRYTEYPETKSPGVKQKPRETSGKGKNNITASCLNSRVIFSTKHF